MNIFALDTDPETAGKWHCDAHCNKMYLEHLQCIANYFTLKQLEDAPLTKEGTPWKHTHSKHPSVLWLGESISNVEWLIELNNVLESERVVRNYNPHFSTPFFNWVKKNYKILPIPVKSQTAFSIAINEDSKCRAVNPNFDKLDPVQQYREFYIHDKTFAIYEATTPPKWLPTYEKDGIFYHMHYAKKHKKNLDALLIKLHLKLLEKYHNKMIDVYYSIREYITPESRKLLDNHLIHNDNIMQQIQHNENTKN